jgi:hypothetical protein
VSRNWSRNSSNETYDSFLGCLSRGKSDSFLRDMAYGSDGHFPDTHFPHKRYVVKTIHYPIRYPALLERVTASVAWLETICRMLSFPHHPYLGTARGVECMYKRACSRFRNRIGIYIITYVYNSWHWCYSQYGVLSLSLLHHLQYIIITASELHTINYQSINQSINLQHIKSTHLPFLARSRRYENTSVNVYKYCMRKVVTYLCTCSKVVGHRAQYSSMGKCIKKRIIKCIIQQIYQDTIQ